MKIFFSQFIVVIFFLSSCNMKSNRMLNENTHNSINNTNNKRKFPFTNSLNDNTNNIQKSPPKKKIKLLSPPIHNTKYNKRLLTIKNLIETNNIRKLDHYLRDLRLERPEIFQKIKKSELPIPVTINDNGKWFLDIVHLAIYYQNIEIIDILFNKYGFDIESKNEKEEGTNNPYGRTPLITCICIGNDQGYEIGKLLINKYGANINNTDLRYNSNPLMWFIWQINKNFNKSDTSVFNMWLTLLLPKTNLQWVDQSQTALSLAMYVLRPDDKCIGLILDLSSNEFKYSKTFS